MPPLYPLGLKLMKIDTQPRKSGARLFLIAALFLSLFLYPTSGCRKDNPPVFSIICLGDGFGGADCSLADGSKKYLSPTELKDFWMTTNADMQNFSSWCYNTDPKTGGAALDNLRNQIRER
jgi:hypothetical protein